MLKLTRILLCALAISLVLVGATACTGARMHYEASGGAYTANTVTEIAETVDLPSALGQPLDRAGELRHAALTDLRKQGDDAADLADFLTSEFPEPARAVPYLGAAALFEGNDAWIVLEVWGLPDSTMDMARLWVFERKTGRVLYSAAIPTPAD